VLAIYHYGMIALFTFMISIFFVLLPTYISLKMAKRRLADIEYENYYYALLFALVLPAGTSYLKVASGALAVYLITFFPAAGSVLRIANPIAATSVFLTLAFNETMSLYHAPKALMSREWLNPFLTSQYFEDFLYNVHHGQFSTNEVKDLFTLLSGWHPGHYGELSILLIISTTCFLKYKKSVDTAPIFGAFTGLAAAASFYFYSGGPSAILFEFICHAFGTMFLFCSCFVLTDYYSAPQRYFSRFFYGIIFGAAFLALNRLNPGVDCAGYSLLIASVFSPTLDSLSAGGRE